MKTLNSLTLRYERVEDRILMAVNVASDSAHAFWLTRRLALDLCAKAKPYLEKTSSVANKTPAAHRAELAFMERDVALASTREKLSHTPNEVIARTLPLGELTSEISLTAQDSAFRVSIRGNKGSQSSGSMSRQDLQTILHLIEQEIVKAGWIQGAAVEASAQADAAALAYRKRRAN